MNNDNKAAVYSFDQSTRVLIGVRYEEKPYEVKPGETLVAPKDGLRPPYRWNGTDWDQASVEEFNAQRPSMGPVGPSTKDQALNSLGLQISQVMKQQAAMVQAMTALSKLVAQKNSTNGGN
ncbi:hypothetical protein [Limosilactobacillus fermentum]|uniref:hypothetical protein n=1 Tax=Limosilactobacillus fermentum TaxID=1613 RepID=UPI002AC9149F|nr:hypothetical protein [Limosilactobacillus fermentum]